MIDLKSRDMTGGVSTLDRAQFFNYHGTLVPPSNTNLGNLVEETWSDNGLNMSTGRTSTELDQFISQGLPEDPSKPGYFEHTALINEIQGAYRNFVLTGARWEPMREQTDAPIFVQNGRNGGFWPDFLDSGTQMPTNFDSYADFLNVYFDEAVYGSNSFLPIDQNRFYFEIMNEPQWTGVPWANVIDMHQVVTEQVKEVFPQLPIGGSSSGDNFVGTGSNSWAQMRAMIDDMATWQTPSGQSVELDFWTIHNYERYDVAANGTYSQAVFNSPGHVAGIMDLFEAYGNNTLGDPKKFAVTEYGSFNRTNMANGSYGNYPRDEQQWDLVRDIREQLLVYMHRPDRIINATPFVSARHWENAVPTNPAGDNVFWEQDASGDWVETIVGQTFRMYSQVRGEYVAMDIGDPDLQAVAFRDGSTMHILLNNMRSTPQNLDLQALGDQVTSASWTRTYRTGGQNFYLADVDVSANWDDLTLEGDAGAVLTLELAGPAVFDHAIDSTTYYGADTEIPIVTGQLLDTTVDADLTDIVSATLRVGYSVAPSSHPAFTVLVNGVPHAITSDVLEIDDNDDDLLVREIQVPVGDLLQGINDIQFFFPTAGVSGEISAAVLEVRRSIGDYNSSGVLDAGDINTLYGQFGPVSPGDEHDLDENGVVDMADVNEWLHLRNAAAGDTDVDGDLDTRDAVATLAHIGAETAWTRGNFDGDGSVSLPELDIILSGFTGAGPSDITGPVDTGTSAQNPNLIYDPATGSLTLEADGVAISALHLGTQNSFLAQADFSLLDADVGVASTLVDNTANDIGWISGSPFATVGFDDATPVNLGALLPTGLNLAALQSWFDDLSWAGLGVGGVFDLALSSVLPGDANGDGVVDLLDLDILGTNFGLMPATFADGDFNGDGVVDLLDLDILGTNFGNTSSTTVPEPGATGLLLSAIGAILVSYRKNRA